MQYLFHVRHWNLNFYLNLMSIICTTEKSSKFRWFTMEKSVYIKLYSLALDVYYLPDYFSQNSIKKSNESLQVEELDKWMNNNCGYGIEFIYDMERFKVPSYEKFTFIKAHIEVLSELILSNSKMIALSCDHFIYYISAYINSMKNGENFFVQPIGFPLCSQVILENPFTLKKIRDKSLCTSILDDYTSSLTLNPFDSIHYMKPHKNISYYSSIRIRLKSIFKSYKINNNMFTYLEPKCNNFIPSRIYDVFRFKFQTDFINEYDLEYLSSHHKVFYFPLQFEPEMSIMAYSPWYKSQLEIVRLICQSLKYGDILILKENPKMIGYRDKKFYSAFGNFNQIRWAHPNLNSRDIIRRSYKVISISGTACIEAACLGINSLLFGYPPFYKMILKEPIASTELNLFNKILYQSTPKHVIIDNVRKEWEQFSQSIFDGNFSPEYVGETFEIKDYKKLSEKFAREVLKLNFNENFTK